MKKTNFEERLYVATVSDDYEKLIKREDIGVEIDHFCMAEYMYGDKYKAAEEEISNIVKMMNGRKAIILHAPFNELFPAAIDPEARDFAMKRLTRAADLAEYFGAEKMVVHSGYMPYVYFKEWHIDRSVEFWEEFMSRRDRTFHIAIENVLEDEPYMMAEMMSKIKNQNIRLCLDTGHVACLSSVNVREWVEVLAPFLGHFHIHNNDGKNDLHAPLGEGKVNMKEIIDSILCNCNDDITVTIESMDGLNSFNWLKERGYI